MNQKLFRLCFIFISYQLSIAINQIITKNNPRNHRLHLRRTRDDLRDNRFTHTFAIHRHINIHLDKSDRSNSRRIKPRLLARWKMG